MSQIVLQPGDQHQILRSSAVFVLHRGELAQQRLTPNVPVVFCETRQLAEEWTYRFLAAARA